MKNVVQMNSSDNSHDYLPLAICKASIIVKQGWLDKAKRAHMNEVVGSALIAMDSKQTNSHNIDIETSALSSSSIRPPSIRPQML